MLLQQDCYLPKLITIVSRHGAIVGSAVRRGPRPLVAVKATYVLTLSDKGATITVTVTGKKAGYSTVSKGSAKTVPVAAGRLTTSIPRVTGTAKVGKNLKVAPGTWGPSPVKLKYQWRANGSAIKGATKSTHKLTSKQKSKKITVSVTGSRAGYGTVTKTSVATGKVKQ